MKIKDDDILLLNQGGTDYKITAAQYKEYVNSDPWDDQYPRFHLIVPPQGGEINIGVPDVTDLLIYEITGKLHEGDSIQSPGEYIVCGDPYIHFTGSSGTWDFGPLTDTTGQEDMTVFMLNCRDFDGKFGGKWVFTEAQGMQSSFWYCASMTTAEGMGDWDMSKWPGPGSLQGMFNDCTNFNADLSQWCVSNITYKPEPFDNDCPNWEEKNKPVWGTCPRGEDQS